MQKQKLFNKKVLLQSPWILYGLSFVFFLFVFVLYYQRAVSFSFIDEFNNYLAGYFLLQGKQLYTQIFFQHNMLLAYISALLQFFLHPQTMYKLVLYHRLFVVVFALFWEAWFVIRFRWLGLVFAIVFELSKFYSFGSVFLAESFIVYPLVYLFFLTLELVAKRHILRHETIVAGICAWFIVWMREPYVPLAIFLYGVLLWRTNEKKERFLSLLCFISGTLAIAFTTDWSSYVTEVIKINYIAVAKGEVQNSGLAGFGIVQIFLYPLIIFFKGHWNVFRQFSIGLSSLFFLSMGLYIFLSRKVFIPLFILFTLSLAALRLETPGTTFFQAYHMNIWYGLTIAATIWIAMTVATGVKGKKIGQIVFLLLFCLIGYIFFWQKSYLKDHVDREHDFTVSYGRYYTYGSLVSLLSAPANDSLFVDSWDCLIYWQAKQQVAYPYLFFYPPMNSYPPYLAARTEMFQKYPPTFYYFYSGETNYYSPGIPEVYKNDYVQIYTLSGPSDLAIYKKAIPEISQDQWKKARELGYSLPKGK